MFMYEYIFQHSLTAYLRRIGNYNKKVYILNISSRLKHHHFLLPMTTSSHIRTYLSIDNNLDKDNHQFFLEHRIIQQLKTI